MQDVYAKAQTGSSVPLRLVLDYAAAQTSYRQSMATRDVQEPGVPVSGADFAERISALLKRPGWSKNKLARKIGVRWQTVHEWTTGESKPRQENLERIAKEMPVTLEELLGIAEGQDPPFRAWKEFLAVTPNLTPSERRSLQAMVWEPGKEPTVASYQIALAALHSTRERVA